MAVLIGHDGDWRLYSKNGTNEGGEMCGPPDKDVTIDVHFTSLQEFANSKYNFDHNRPYYLYAYQITTTPDQDAEMRIAADKACREYYEVVKSNCQMTAVKALLKIGKNPGYNPFSLKKNDIDPSPVTQFKFIKFGNKGKDVSKLIKRDSPTTNSGGGGGAGGADVPYKSSSQNGMVSGRDGPTEVAADGTPVSSTSTGSSGGTGAGGTAGGGGGGGAH